MALLLLVLLLVPSAHGLPDCQPEFAGGQTEFSRDCNWQQQIEGVGGLVLEGELSLQRLPFLVVGSMGATASTPAAPDPGFTSLTVRRLLLSDVAVSPPTGQGGVPVLLPLGLFAAAPTNLSLVDVRLVVSQRDFAAFLQFFSQQLDAEGLTAAGGSISFHTDGKSFLHVPSWSNSNTRLLAVTLVTAPCRIFYGPGQQTVEWQPLRGCNLLAANNEALVPLLLRNASIPTTEPLLVRITSNVTLGPGLKGSLPIRRPVILLGLASELTSVDLGMVVNQLNVTGPTGLLVWQGLVLENLAPGDTLSSVVAAPYSTTTSTNMWAIYCNRSAALCVRMNNVTLVIPTEREVSYHIFMYTMYSSPAPSLRQLAIFMRTDLGFKHLEFAAGPGNDTMTIKRLLSRSWQFKDVITTARTFIAPPLPLPQRPFVLARSGPAPLVQAIKDCATFNAALNYNSSRVFVWRLLKNVSLVDERGQRSCAFSSGFVAAPTHLFGQVIAEYTRSPAAAATAGGLAALGVSSGPSSASASSVDASTSPDSGDGGDTSTPPGDAFSSLSFGFIPSVFELPGDAQDKFMQIQNVTLQQLPQRPPDDSSSSASTGGGRAGRRLKQLPGASSATPPGIWTILLHPWRRSSDNPVIFIADSQLLLPEPEWSLLAQVASGDDSFAMQLQGPAGLTFTGVSVHQQVIHVGSLQGPGVSGSNLWLMPDPTPVSAMPGYTWPASLAAAAVQSDSSRYSVRRGSSSSSEPHGLSAAAVAGIGVSVGVLGALTAALAALLLRRQRRQRRAALDADMLPKPEQQRPSCDSCCQHHAPDQGGGGVTPCSDPGQLLLGSGSSCVDVALQPDAKTSAHHQRQQQQQRLAAKAAAAAKGRATASDALARTLAAGMAERVRARSSAGGSGGTSDNSPAASAPGDSGRLSSKAAAAGGNAGSDLNAAVVGRTGSGSSATVEQSIAQGLERWSAAVSATTLQLMQRRPHFNNQTAMFPSSSGSNSGRIPALPSTRSSGADAAGAGAVGGGSRGGRLAATSAAAAAATAGGGQWDSAACVELQEVLGHGSFATVYKARWANKDVAVKVMHLPADALVAPLGGADAAAAAAAAAGSSSTDGSDGGGAAEAGDEQLQLQQRRQWQRQQNSPPHMAIIEAVVSSTMCHPNIAQVFTYQLSPLMARDVHQPPSGNSSSSRHRDQQLPAAADGADDDVAARTAAAAAAAAHKQHRDAPGIMSGWQLRIILEYCPEGTLREALDRKRLPRVPGTTFLMPAVVLSLCHDIAAALFHLHREGIVHGDLKAGNVLLTAGQMITSAAAGAGCAAHHSTQQQLCSCGQPAESLAESWTKLGSLPLTAKVSDFGLSIPLRPTDTHATMLARGTPTHMSPELFMAGHVSRASDVHAFGILIFEIVSGRRAYAGVPVPLLPHEVAMRGLRPEWPPGLPPQCAAVQRLAEACWQQEPQDRPSFADILKVLEGCCPHSPPAAAAAAAAASASGGAAQPGAAAAAAQPSLLQQLPQKRLQVRLQVPSGLQPPPAARRSSPLGPPQQQPQQQQPSPLAAAVQDGAGPRPPVAEVAAKNNNLSWSEVSYTHGDD